MNTEGREMARLEAFSDGVFAIAITLLILELKVPHLSESAGPSELARAMVGNWPSYFAFTASFASILIMWMNHHGIFRLVKKADSPFVLANGFLLFTVTLFPFPTALISEYLEKPAAKAASVTYAATYVLISIAYNALWLSAAYKNRLLKPGLPTHEIRLMGRSFLLGFPIYALALALSFFFPLLGVLVCSSLWILWAFLAHRNFPK